MVEGAVKYFKSGLGESLDIFKQAISDYKDSITSPIQSFIMEVLEGDYSVPSDYAHIKKNRAGILSYVIKYKDLYTLYVSWRNDRETLIIFPISSYRVEKNSKQFKTLLGRESIDGFLPGEKQHKLVDGNNLRGQEFKTLNIEEKN